MNKYFTTNGKHHTNPYKSFNSFIKQCFLYLLGHCYFKIISQIIKRILLWRTVVETLKEMSIPKSQWTKSVQTILTKESKVLSIALVFRNGHTWDGFFPGIWEVHQITGNS